MNVTFDTNTFGPLCSQEDYPDNPDLPNFAKIKDLITLGKINPYISEGSLSLEALSHNDRIDKFIREWAKKSKGIELPEPAPIRIAIVEKAFELGVKVLHVPRIALGSFVEVPEQNWALDANFPTKERQERYFQFVRDFSSIGPSQLKKLGASLVTLHNIDTSHVINFPGWPTPEELLWAKGIVAEYDNPKQFESSKKFTRHIRDIIAEWDDLDILASHYGYGFELFCTNDQSKSTGIKGVFHSTNQRDIFSKYNIRFVTPYELIGKIDKNV
ncbi:hypothetical protein ACFL5B_02255 [Candidatus Latescibacterota bacterium]